MREFQSYLSERLCDESLLFWNDVVSQELDTRDLCKLLWDRYIRDGAAGQIAFASNGVDRMRRCLEKESLDAEGLEELEAALAMLLAECSGMLHDHALDFINDSKPKSADLSNFGR